MKTLQGKWIAQRTLPCPQVCIAVSLALSEPHLRTPSQAPPSDLVSQQMEPNVRQMWILQSGMNNTGGSMTAPCSHDLRVRVGRCPDASRPIRSRDTKQILQGWIQGSAGPPHPWTKKSTPPHFAPQPHILWVGQVDPPLMTAHIPSFRQEGEFSAICLSSP